ncbi:hypothetical protein R5H30_04715 [Sulfitobacter sp. D35]|uniref:hypothetical protein n=1 Tax=Sulfitobacter sp. D35 TaxID=3083252 RepID=UPI00296E9E7E|nr:hypothetical protein [Sulfitobacter sp. D35]MDW4497273.1 hypothetical protein [Sulfitobacter sp. D35]
MIGFTEEEKKEVVDYFLDQSPDGTEVTFAQKLYAEAVMDHTHAVWDIHASDGRWWVITNPTNLYSQNQFPNLDLALTFHVGLCLRIPRNDLKQADIERVRPFTSVLNAIQECDLALSQANDPGAFRAIGVRCRENLLAFVHAAQDTREWPAEDKPQRSNFVLWVDKIFDSFLEGANNRERRRLIKTTLKETWVYVNWLTHSQSGKWVDAEVATSAVSYAIGMATSICVRYLRGVPEECPVCDSHRLFPEEGSNSEYPEVLFERPRCSECGWAGDPVPVGERSEDEAAQFITRDGDESDECSVMQTPLMEVAAPRKK